MAAVLVKGRLPPVTSGLIAPPKVCLAGAMGPVNGQWVGGYLPLFFRGAGGGRGFNRASENEEGVAKGLVGPLARHIEENCS